MLLTPLKPTLEAAFRDVGASDARYRIAAAERLGEVGLVRSADEGVAADGYRARREIPGEVSEEHRRAHDALVALLGDRVAGVRGAAAESLGRLLLDREEEVRRNAARRLRTLEEGESSPGVRQAAIGAAADLWPSTLEWLEPFVEDDDPALRYEAARALLQHAPTRAEELLAPRLSSEADSDIRRAIAQGFGERGQLGEDGRAALRELLALAREDYELALEAAIALAHLGEAEAEPLLVHALETRRGDGYDVARSLGQIATARGRDALHSRGRGFFTSSFIKLACGAALAKLDDHRGDAILGKLLRSRNEAQIHAIHAVGKLDRRELLPELLRLAAQNPRNWAERDALVDALESFRDDERVPPAILALAG